MPVFMELPTIRQADGESNVSTPPVCLCVCTCVYVYVCACVQRCAIVRRREEGTFMDDLLECVEG